MKNITILLTIHKINEEYEKMILNAINSIEDFHNDVKLMLIYPKTISNEIKKLSLSQKTEIVHLEHENSTDFISQINLGINNCDTEWFSILELDDIYTKLWLKTMDEYIKAHTDVDVFLPIVKDVNTDGLFVGFTNESTWAYGFCEKQGILDNETLLDYQNYQISGGLFKTNVVKDNGLFKDNIKLTFAYEFLLRLTHNNVKIMVIPKIGYEHVVMREDSIFWLLKNDENLKLSDSEVNFWLESAKKEFFFKNKRDLNFVPS
jgi:hypothetical protein